MAEPPDLCRFHYRPAVAHCEGCGGGVCPTCVQAGRDGRSYCAGCAQRATDDVRRRELLREDRLELRRAGVIVSSEEHDPLVLHGGPLRLAVPGAGGLALVLAAGALAALAQSRLGLDATFAALFLAPLVGQVVRLLFGGVSRVAGLSAAGVGALSVVCARWFAGGGATAAGAPLASLRARSDTLLGPPWVPLACVAAAAVVAYRQAAGRRLARTHRPIV